MSELIIESHKNATIIVFRSGCEQHAAPHPLGQNMAATIPRDLMPAGTQVSTTLSNLWLWVLLQNTKYFYIAADEWASYSPDLVYKGRQLPFANLQDLKEAIKNKWKVVTIETIRKSIAQWKKRLNAVRKHNGGAIQQVFC